MDTFHDKTDLSNFETGFVDWHILREKRFEAFRPVLDTLFYVYNLLGVLDTSKCRMSHRRWRVHKPSLIELSRD